MVEQEVLFKGQIVPYRVNFNRRRKTRSVIKIHPDGCVLVDVPVTANLLQIRRWVSERAEWLLRRRSEIEDGRGFVRPLSYAEDGQHLFLGKAYSLKLVESKQLAHRQGVSGQSLTIHAVRTDPDSVKVRLWRWYREQAHSVFQQRLSDLSETVPWVDSVPELKLRKMRRRWGSCTSRGLVTLNTHLIKAPVEMIDYVILHELCHTIEKNHGKDFWKLFPEAEMPAKNWV